MDKALAYRRDVGRNTVARRDAARSADTEHRMTVCHQEAVIRATMGAIEAAGVGGNVDEGALQ
jgi:hypothetical protein